MTTRPSKKTIEPLLDEYARLELRCVSIELKRDQELGPLKAAYEKKAAPIVNEAKEKLDTIKKRMSVLAGDINAQLMSGVDEKAETVALSEVVVEIETTKSLASAIAVASDAEAETIRTGESGRPLIRAVARVEPKPGNREILAEKFFNFVEASKRIGKFWSCFKVQIGAVEKFIGKEKTDELAKKRKTFSVSIGLRP